MELNYFNVITGLWISGVFILMWKLWFTSHNFLKKSGKHKLVVKYWWVTFLLFLILCTLALPFLVPVILSEKARERFLEEYINALEPR